MNRSTRVTVWNEFRHERTNAQVGAVYPDGIHEALAAPLRRAGFDVRTATLDEPDHGLGARLCSKRPTCCSGGAIRRTPRCGTKSSSAFTPGCRAAWG